MRKGILSSILVIQLVLLVLLTFTELQSEREVFSLQTQYQRLSSYKFASAYEDIARDLIYMKEINATQETTDIYVDFVNNTFEKVYLLEIELNQTNIKISNNLLEMQKEGTI